jgi:hypothetical protein
MTMSQNEKAFPISSNHYEHGMDLRDYFAAKAMQALVGNDPDSELTDHAISIAAYDLANAMMKARGK